MAEKGILFSAPMVRALLAGTKTQTRRVVKWQGPKSFPHYFDRAFIDTPAGVQRLCVPYHHPNDPDIGDGNSAHRHYPPQGDPGDRLWVRETWSKANDAVDYRLRGQLLYRADPHDPRDIVGVKWKPAIHMPRTFSRITLELTVVRVERLQDISEADAIAEGVEPAPQDDGRAWQVGPHVAAYERLWESINGEGSWDANPWVWVLAFRRIDALAREAGNNVAGNRLARQGQSELTGVLGACNEKRGNDGEPTTDE